MKNLFRKSTRVELTVNGNTTPTSTQTTNSLTTNTISSPSSISPISFSFLLPTAENLSREQPNGMDLLEYANGDIYDGEVNLKNQRHGSGVCRFAQEAERDIPPSTINTNQPALLSFTGKWFSNQPCIDTQAVVTYANGDRYCGTVMAYDEELLNNSSVLAEYYHCSYHHRSLASPTHMSPTNTHGSAPSSSSKESAKDSSSSKTKKKSGFFTSTSEGAAEALLGKIPYGDDGLPFVMKHGEGELHYVDGSKYNGSFRKDVRDGFGVMVDNQNQTEYYGYWKDNEKDGFGTMIFKDGTVYEGDWRDGKQGGKGILRLPNGDRIKGFWDGNNILKGAYEKGSVLNVRSKCPIMLLREEVKKTEKIDKTTSFSHVTTPILSKEDLVSQKKWDGLFAIFLDGIKIEKDKYANSSTSKFIEEKKAQKEGNISPMSRKSIQDTLQTYLNDAIQHKLSKMTYDDVTQVARTSFDETPIYGILSTATNDHVLSRIISKFVNLFNWKYHQSDIKSGATARYQIPHALDDYHSFVIYLFEVTCQIIGQDAVSVFGQKKLLYLLKDYVLSRIYSTLFTIYKYCYQEQDNIYKFKMLALSNITMRELGVKDGFIPTEEMESLFQNPYEECIKKLRTLSTQYATAHDKFDILVEVGKELIRAIDFIEEKKRGKISDRGADDTLPVYLYVFIQAQIPNVYSTFKFLLDFMDEKVQTTEQGYRFSVFENAIQFIPMIDSSIRDTNGILVPTFVLEDRLESCVNKIKREAKESGDVVRLLWLSSVFIIVGSTLSEQTQQHVTPTSPSGTNSPNQNTIVELIHSHHNDLFRKYLKYAEKVLNCVSLKVEVIDVDPSTLLTKQPSFRDVDQEDWTNLEKKKSQEEIIPTKTYRIIVDQIYPSHIYFKMARKLEELIDEI